MIVYPPEMEGGYQSKRRRRGPPGRGRTPSQSPYGRGQGRGGRGAFRFPDRRTGGFQGGIGTGSSKFTGLPEGSEGLGQLRSAVGPGPTIPSYSGQLGSQDFMTGTGGRSRTLMDLIDFYKGQG